MAGMTVEYIIGLVDEATGPATRMWAAVQKATRELVHMGEASLKADKIMADWAKSTNAAAAGLDNIAVAARKGAAEILAEGKAMRELNAAAERANQINARMTRPPPLPRQGAHTSGYYSKHGMMHGVAPGLMNAYFGMQLAEGALHGVDSFMDKPAEVDTLMKRGHMMGLSDAELGKMRSRATELSAKNKNMSIADNMQIILDARTNMIGSFDDILKDVGSFSELGSFMKAWDAKSGGGGKDLLKELNTAIRSGELAGNTSGEELAKHAQALAAMKILYGDRVTAEQYFAAQKASGAIFPSLNDQFKYVDMPALINRMGSRAGVGLLSMMQKDVAGINVRPESADEYRRLGLVDDSKVTLKNGHIQKGSLHAGWMKGTDQLMENPEEWMMRTLLPAIEKGGKVRGLNAERMLKEWESGDSEALRKDMRRVNKGDLFAELGKLSADRTGTQELMQGLTASPMILRDRQLRAAIQNDLQSFDDYNRAKQEVSTAVDNAIVKITGDNAMNNVIAGLHKLRDWFNRVGDFFTPGKVDLSKPPPGSPLANALDNYSVGGGLFGTHNTSSSIATGSSSGLLGGLSAQAAGMQSQIKIDIPTSIDLNVHVDGAGIQPGSTSASLPIAASRGEHQDGPGAWQKDH